MKSQCQMLSAKTKFISCILIDSDDDGRISTIEWTHDFSGKNCQHLRTIFPPSPK